MRSPHTSYRWRREKVIEPIKCMRSPHTSYRWRGERVIEPIKCMRSTHNSYRWRREKVIEPIKSNQIKSLLLSHKNHKNHTIKCMRSPHTSYRWRRERVIESIKWMGIIRRPWLTRASGGNLTRTPGLHPTLYEKCHGIFNDHRESRPRFNISSERCMYFVWCFQLFIPGGPVGWCTPAVVF